MPAMIPVTRTEIFELPFFKRGKVRDIYDCGSSLLMIATDRLSAFDVVLPSAIPRKGEVLTQISLFWFDRMKDIVPNHILSGRFEDFPTEVSSYRQELEGRSILVKKVEPVMIECVVRGYLAGSGWKEYQASGAVCSIPLPAGLRLSEQLPEPIFTPAIKAESGHDENVSETVAADRIGGELCQQLKQMSLAIYRRACEYAGAHGLILADTKFEFGLEDGKIILIDELLTPDSSRFWLASEYAPGKQQESFDKQFVRDYLERIGWNKQPPGPELPPEVVEGTSRRYVDAYVQLTGRTLSSR